MKRIIHKIFIFCIVALLGVSCESFKEVNGVDNMELVALTLNIKISVPGITDYDGLVVRLDNAVESFSVSQPVTGWQMTVEDLIPGKYNISVGGRTLDENGIIYNLGDAKQNISIIKDESLDFDLLGSKESPLIFKEAFWSNRQYTSESGSLVSYIFSQFWEIYNNSEYTVYLDDVYFAEAYPQSTTSSGGNTIYYPGELKITDFYNEHIIVLRIWKFPGTGEDYPLAPGESAIITMRAQNHKLIDEELWDYSTAEFEFYMPGGGAEFDFPAPNMEHIYVNNSSSHGTLKQYMAAAAGPAVVLFKLPVDINHNFFLESNQMYTEASSGTKTYYAKLPIDWILDAIDSGQNETSRNYKRLPAMLDKGMIVVGSAYTGKSVARKILEEIGPSGFPVYQDTNDSTEDFELMDEPMIRRYGANMPAWNHTLN